MGILKISDHDAVSFEYEAPTSTKGCTFVFFNALTGDKSAWNPVIHPRLSEAGHGFLVFNLRGQSESPFSPELKLGPDLIVEDVLRLLDHVNPIRPLLVGLSIGGLFAAGAWLKGANAHGLVLINTLRRDGPRLKWIGDALVRAVEVGGLDLFRDLFLPLLMNEGWLKENRGHFLKSEHSYVPLPQTGGHYKLLSEAGREADWNLPYEALSLPVLVMTGLQDHVFLETDVVEDLFSRLPKGRRIDLPGAGHLIPQEQPDEPAQALLSFAEEM
ncbi:MAG: alpha/beta fold hydrolase [Desulfomonilaceae bacterium]|nr:alpha/beta fold hydrolase [Desulfomonilaceae bacterium]